MGETMNMRTKQPTGRRFGRIMMTTMAILLTAAVMHCRPWKHKSPEERAEWIAKRISKELDLNDTQKQTLNKIKGEVLARHKAEKVNRDLQFGELTKIMRADTIDNTKLTEIRKRHQAQREGVEALFVEKAVELHKVLTPAQRNKAADLLEKYMKHFSGEK